MWWLVISLLRWVHQIPIPLFCLVVTVVLSWLGSVCCATTEWVDVHPWIKMVLQPIRPLSSCDAQKRWEITVQPTILLCTISNILHCLLLLLEKGSLHCHFLHYLITTSKIISILDKCVQKCVLVKQGHNKPCWEIFEGVVVLKWYMKGYVTIKFGKIVKQNVYDLANMCGSHSVWARNKARTIQNKKM